MREASQVKVVLGLRSRQARLASPGVTGMKRKVSAMNDCGNGTSVNIRREPLAFIRVFLAAFKAVTDS